MLTITPQRARLSDGSYQHNLLIYNDHESMCLQAHDSIKLHCIDETASIKLAKTLKRLTVDF